MLDSQTNSTPLQTAQDYSLELIQMENRLKEIEANYPCFEKADDPEQYERERATQDFIKTARQHLSLAQRIVRFDAEARAQVCG